MSQVHREVEGLQQGQSEEGRKMQSLLGQLSEMEIEVSRQQGMVAEYDRKNLDLQQQLEKERNQCEELKNEASEKVKFYENRNTEQETKMESLQQQLLQSLQLVQEKETSYQDQLKSSKEQYNKMVEETRLETNALKKETDELRNTISERDIQLASQVENLEHVSNEMIQKDKQIRELRTQLDEFSKSNQELETTKISLNDSLVEAESQVRKTTEEGEMKNQITDGKPTRNERTINDQCNSN